jgi:recombination protein RecT
MSAEGQMTVAEQKREQRRKLVDGSVERAMVVAAKHITRERFAGLVLGAMAKTPHLDEVTPASFAMCLMTCAQLGLEPNTPMGYAYLIPRRAKGGGGYECTIILGYKGLLELARRSGEIATMDARVVFKGETVKVTAGTRGMNIEHEIDPFLERGGVNKNNAAQRIVGAYATIVTKDGATYTEFITVSQIEERRKRGASGSGSTTPWDTDYIAMARKSAVRALLMSGLVPLSPEVFEVVRNDEPDTIDAEELAAKRAVAAPWKQLPDLSSPAESDLDGDAAPAERVERSEPPAKAAEPKPAARSAASDDVEGM